MNATALRRELGLQEALGLVIGTIIGTGIFLKTTTMSLLVGSATWVLMAWAVAGLLSLVGALVYAELGELFPEAGGEYVYLRSAYGDWLGFLYGWMRFWIGSPGSIAAYAVGSATFFSALVPMGGMAKSVMALTMVFLFTTLNCMAVKVGGRAQWFLTLLKIALIFGLTFGIFFFSSGGSFSNMNLVSEGAVLPGFTWGGFGLAVLSALWAFDGWNNLPMAAGEIKSPAKTIPAALVIGVVIIFVIYALSNLAYFYALPFGELLLTNSKSNPEALPVATAAAKTFLGEAGVSFLAIAMTISALGAMNGSILTSSRIPYAMARDGLFPVFLAKVSSFSHVPVAAVIVQGVWSGVLALSGSFDQLTDWVVFSAWIFYALCGFAVIVFRKKFPERHRQYKVPLYPMLPIVFCSLAVLLLVNTLWESPRESMFGLLFIAVGVPAFWLFRRFQGGRPA